MPSKVPYIRLTAINDVKSLLENLPKHHDQPHDAIRMIDRTIGGLLAHPKSPYYLNYRNYAQILFPRGLEATVAGHDIILILNNNRTVSTKNGVVVIPEALKNPEKGVAQVIGDHLARTLFLRRQAILEQLLGTKINEDWSKNVAANEQALQVLGCYSAYPSIFDKPLISDDIRPAAIEYVKHIFKNLPSHPVSAIKIIDLTIDELFKDKEPYFENYAFYAQLISRDSAYYQGYQKHASVLFSNRIGARLCPGEDIILISNNKNAIISSLNHIEKGVMQMIGRYLALMLFKKRGNILEQLIKENKGWQANVDANGEALTALFEYNFHSNNFYTMPHKKPSWTEQLMPCFISCMH